MQKVYVENNVPLTSFDEIQRWLGVLEPGLYRGFDDVVFLGNTATCYHEFTGIRKTDITGDDIGPYTAVVITKQGSIVNEDANIALNVDYNEGNSMQRVDYLVGSHEYQNSPGGVDMVFSIIKGPLESANEPSLTDANNQVLIGKIYIPAGAANHGQTTWERADRPGLANKNEVIESPNNTLSVAGDFTKALDIKTPLEAPADFNDFITPGLFRVEQVDDIPNGPTTGSYSEALVLVSNDDGNIFQVVFTSSARFNVRRKDNGSAWSSWTYTAMEVDISNLQASIALKASKAQPGWNALPLANGWVASGSNTPQYRKDEFGMVHFRGTLEATNSTNRTFVDTGGLPAAYRPPVVSVALCPNANPGVGITPYGRVQIDNEVNLGRMSVYDEDYDTNADLVLDGITYDTSNY